MADIAVELAGGLTGTALGAEAAKLTGAGGGSSGIDMSQFNSILNKALQNALNTSSNYTNQAIGQQNQSLTTASSDIQNAVQQANQGLFNSSNSAFNIGQGLLTPYRNAGYNANDALSQSLGLATPQGGSQFQAQQNSGAAQAAQYAQNLFGSNAPPTLGAAPTLDPNAYQQYLQPVSQAQINNYIQSHLAGKGNAVNYNGVGSNLIKVPLFRNNLTALTSNPNIQNAIQQAIQQENQQSAQQQAQQAFQTQQQQYNTQQQKLQQYNDYLKQIGYDPNAQVPNIPATTSGNTGTGSAGQQGLSNFLNSPEYQALFGNGAANQIANNGTYDPTRAFAQDPGTQYAIQQALKSVQQQGAAKGLLESGNMQNALVSTAQGIQNQQYQNYQTQLANTFNQYQNQLAGLTNLGSGLTGANTAAQLFSQLGINQGNNTMSGGSQLANANLSTGNNIASLLANQGVLGANAYLNTGAAQANGLMNATLAQMQANAQGAASQAQTNSAQQMSNAYMQAANLFGYGNPVNPGYGTTTNYGNGQSTYSGNPWGVFGRTGGSF